MHKGEWHCETADGFLVVRATPAVISMGFAEREVNKTDEMCIVGGVMDKKNKLIIASMFGSMYDDEGYITFGEIAKFMKWQINKEQIWDG